MNDREDTGKNGCVHCAKKHDATNEENVAGFGILAGAALALGAAVAFLYGTETGRSERKALRRWMADMRSDIVKSLQDLKYIDQDTYYQIIDDLVEQYQHNDEVDGAELIDFARDMKDRYYTLKQEIEKAKREDQTKTTTSKKKTTRKTPLKKRASSTTTKKK